MFVNPLIKISVVMSNKTAKCKHIRLPISSFSDSASAEVFFPFIQQFIFFPLEASIAVHNFYTFRSQAWINWSCWQNLHLLYWASLRLIAGKLAKGLRRQRKEMGKVERGKRKPSSGYLQLLAWERMNAISRFIGFTTDQLEGTFLCLYLLCLCICLLSKSLTCCLVFGFRTAQSPQTLLQLYCWTSLCFMPFPKGNFYLSKHFFFIKQIHTYMHACIQGNGTVLVKCSTRLDAFTWKC